MCKQTLERFLLMYPSEVLRTFAQLPGAIVHQDFVYIPGTRPDRILLVAHADTVANKPPDYLEWSGNLLRGDWKVAPSKPAAPSPSPQVAKTTGALVAVESQVTVVDTKTTPLAQAIQQFRDASKQPVLTGLNSDDPPHPFSDGKPQVAATTESRSILDDIRANLPFEEIAKKYNIEVKTVELVKGSMNKPVPVNAPKLSPAPVTRYVDDDEYSEWGFFGRYGGYDKCLGADDRAGIAILWLMRRSGHSLLITDHEEIGGEGAIQAVKELGPELSKHQFAMQIDRRFDQEMVFYSCSTKKFEKYMRRATRYSVGQGSFTDISIICPAVGICGVNLSAGYWNEHSRDEMLSYDAWKRTHDVVHRMLWRESHPRFVLPPERKQAHKRGTHWSDQEYSRANADWWQRELGVDPYTRAWDRGYGATEPERPSTYVPDEEIVAYQIGTIVLCREGCQDYVSIAQQDNLQAALVKLRQQDIAEWDVCETCGKKLWELPDLALEATEELRTFDSLVAEIEAEEPLEANAPMIHLTGMRTKHLAPM